MRVTVEEERCQGHTLCAMAAPEVFDLREDDGHSVVKLEEVPTRLAGAVRRAVDSCPERAISITD